MKNDPGSFEEFVKKTSALRKKVVHSLHEELALQLKDVSNDKKLDTITAYVADATALFAILLGSYRRLLAELRGHGDTWEAELRSMWGVLRELGLSHAHNADAVILMELPEDIRSALKIRGTTPFSDRNLTPEEKVGQLRHDLGAAIGDHVERLRTDDGKMDIVEYNNHVLAALVSVLGRQMRLTSEWTLDNPSSTESFDKMMKYVRSHAKAEWDAADALSREYKARSHVVADYHKSRLH